MMPGGSIALSGLTGGAALTTTVFPFIIRGVNLLGIEAVWTPMPRRQRVWRRLATDLKPRGLLDSIAVETDLEGVEAVAAQIVAGKVRGRTLVRIS
jgi:NADPH:quinone reductase-like Zn-dependent oxidoreductase